MTATLGTLVAPKRLARRLSSVGPLGAVSAVVIGVAALIAVIGPWIAPYDPDTTDGITLQFADASGHLFGYDANGRDVFSRLLAGARTSMLGPLIVVVASITLGVAIAIAAAWRGGRFDTLVSSALDIAFAFPGILLAILAAAVFGAGLFAAVLVLSLAYTPYIARVVRGSALQERSKPYIAALEVQGMSGWRICARHLLPNVSGVVVAQGTTLFGYAMVDLAAISFIGLGVQPPSADWGVMVFENRQGLAIGKPMPAVLAGLCLIGVVIAFNILGERLAQRSEARR
ncbi:MAG: ABC transporter permease [Ilumatobacteraceae bacterium]